MCRHGTTMTEIRLLPNERLDDLNHRGRRIIQREDRFRFSMDAVLLAHFPRYFRGCRVLDLGTGTGVMPLLIAEETGAVEAVELDGEMAEMAARSVALNGLSDVIHVREGDYRDLRALCPPESFDVVLANPPYGGTSQGPTAKEEVAAARQECTATLDQVVGAARWALRFHGRFAMVYRPDRLAEVFAALAAHRLEPKRMRLVEPQAGKPAKLVLIEAMQGGAPGGLVMLPTLRVRDEKGAYTEELLQIYGESE